MKHETFRDAAIGEAFEALEELVLPSLTTLIDRAAAARPGEDAHAHAYQLRALAEELATLTALFADGKTGQAGPAPDPFSTDA